MKPVDMTVNKLNKNITLIVNVKTSRQFLVRKWIAGQLIKLAARILGCGIEINTENE